MQNFPICLILFCYPRRLKTSLQQHRPTLAQLRSACCLGPVQSLQFPSKLIKKMRDVKPEHVSQEKLGKSLQFWLRYLICTLMNTRNHLWILCRYSLLHYIILFQCQNWGTLILTSIVYKKQGDKLFTSIKWKVQRKCPLSYLVLSCMHHLRHQVDKIKV